MTGRKLSAPERRNRHTQSAASVRLAFFIASRANCYRSVQAVAADARSRERVSETEWRRTIKALLKSSADVLAAACQARHLLRFHRVRRLPRRGRGLGLASLITLITEVAKSPPPHQVGHLHWAGVQEAVPFGTVFVELRSSAA
ncbi:hypothetical protein SKAU_G00139620 [Synaphobranchus kaupii]|uniref:Uncharacterized protein n=1 Tax=Synaphobranchus kaupii TaxID=118154 RepID=A0A9Q1FSK7_SYNKA|nr:hypothetical protein SKAU_G00139620 [Synaphobranchus kaupii]